ncbi:unnamed protein product [Macrosiphum euphorbiae]|uniref:Uncharacterized protein n=1 Tax=Macrosiphum euphorbiae TaxID=13131 RepID=A0AAV0XEN9_9HEMI|nr:unnamed protein product [Macrosiphum euphorbiae]
MRKPLLERSINSDKKRFKPSQAYLNTVENSHEEFSFQYLKENLNLLEKPDNKWMFGLTDDEVVLAIWNSGSEKKIIISNDLIVKVSNYLVKSKIKNCSNL